MSITIPKNDLVDVIQKTIPIVPLKSSLQVLSNFKIHAASGHLSISATDLDHSIRCEKEVEGSDSFEITVNARKFSEIARKLPDGSVTIEADGNVLAIQSEKDFSCKLAGADTSDFPDFPEVSDMSEFSLPVAMLRDMVTKSSFAVSRDESRACLRGILWEVEPNRSGMVATDGHRFGCCFYNDTFNVTQKLSSIVAPKTLLHLVKIADGSDEGGVITASVGDKYIMFQSDNTLVCTKLIEGPYPDYEKAIPHNNSKIAFVDKKAMLDAVGRVSVLSSQKTHLIKCLFKECEVEVAALNRDIGGEARERLPIEYAGEEHHIGFNAQYISEILSIIPTPMVRFEMNTQISACLLFPRYEENEQPVSDDLFLIMPLRIMDEI